MTTQAWGNPLDGIMDEIPRWHNPATGELEVINSSPKWSDAVGLAKDYLARVDVTRSTANPATSFIKDPTGSGKLIKFTHPLDLRSVEQKMQGYPFNQL